LGVKRARTVSKTAKFFQIKLIGKRRAAITNDSGLYPAGEELPARISFAWKNVLPDPQKRPNYPDWADVRVLSK